MINRPRPMHKTELKPGEYQGVLKPWHPIQLSTADLVCCPAKSYQATSTKDCKECVFWYGFAPKQRGTEMRPGNTQSLCGVPVGRQVDEIRI